MLLPLKGYYFLKYCFHSLKIDLVLANNVYSDEMLPYAAFYLGLHCLQKFPFMGFQSSKVK